MKEDEIRDLHSTVSRVLGNWWQDERRHWCAYCGIPLRRKAARGQPIPPNKATRDHVIPKAHKGRGLTIPACRQCNEAKGRMSLPEFLISPHFQTMRARKHKNQWSLHQLWAASGLAALKCAEASFASPIADHTR